jgi:hypothetical protein
MVNITVLITSALFVDEQGGESITPVPIRVSRLNETLKFIENFDFGQIFILDDSFPTNMDDVGEIQVTDNQKRLFYKREANYNRKKEYELFGPSRLETNLIIKALPEIQEAVSLPYILKISGGYKVRNLGEILSKFEEAFVYRFGSPFRIRTKFCLTAFYILPKEFFFEFARYCNSNYDLLARTYPLEALLYDFVDSKPFYYTSSTYPDIDAVFMSSGRTSKSLNYQSKATIYRILGFLGFYILRLK